jgi:hypothetical protein
MKFLRAYNPDEGKSKSERIPRFNGQIPMQAKTDILQILVNALVTRSAMAFILLLSGSKSFVSTDHRLR